MKIGQRIAALVVVAVLATVTLLSLIFFRQRREESLTEAAQEVAEVDSTLSAMLDAELLSESFEQLSRLPDAIARAPRIHAVAILSGEDRSMVVSRAIRNSPSAARALAERALRENRVQRASVMSGALETAGYAFPLHSAAGRPIGAAVLLRDNSYVDRLTRESTRQQIVADIALSLVAVIVVLIVSHRSISKPVAVVLEGVRRIGQGTLTKPIALPSNDELGQIAAALNQMMSDLAAAREQLRTELEERIALEKSVEFERRLQHAQRLAAVGQVAASLAHEIGSPLHVIAGRARMAAELNDTAPLQENLRVIATQADRITRVVQQLLSIARKRKPRVERVVVGTVATAVVELLEPQAKQQSVSLSLQLPDDELATSGDPDALQQVLFNLVLNAIQAQPDGGSVEVLVHRVDEKDSLGSLRPRIAVDVLDRGPGVPVKSRDAIFEPFASTKDGTGTGLGLAVVKEIVREHAGSIRVLDRDGGGAIFRVSLPFDDESSASAL